MGGFMKRTITQHGASRKAAGHFDVSLILFFLSIEFGRIANQGGLDLILVGAAVFATIGFSAFSQEDSGRCRVGSIASGLWLATFASIIGFVWSLSIGSTLPQYLGQVPLALVCISTVFSLLMHFGRFLRPQFRHAEA